MAMVLLVVGAVAVKEHIEKKKATQRTKDDARYRELLEETEQRLSRTESGGKVVRRASSDSSSSDEEVADDDALGELASPAPTDEENRGWDELSRARSNLEKLERASTRASEKKNKGLRGFVRRKKASFSA